MKKKPFIDPSGSATNIGRVREHNEDSLVVAAPLYAVADGMGGHEAGEVASEVAIEAMLTQSPKNLDPRALRRAVRVANQEVFSAVETGLGKEGMGTTLTAAIVDGTSCIIAQVGDSRAYLLHNGELQRITRDHSLVANLVEQGTITEEEARNHPNRSVITRALGSDPNMVPDIFEIDGHVGDRLLLCTDGLTGMVEDEKIREILQMAPTPQEAADQLISEANAGGGHDNITAVVVSLESIQPKKQRSRRRKILAPLAWIVVVGMLLVATFFGLRSYAYNSTYLGQENGQVALYRGLPNSLMGLSFTWPISGETTLSVDALSTSQQQKIRDGWPQSSLEEGIATLEYLKRIPAKDTIDDFSPSQTTTSPAGTKTPGGGNE